MRHFVRVKTRISESKKKGVKEIIRIIYPTFLANSNDLMKKGGKFYAVLDPLTNKWTTDESKVVEIVDRELYSELNNLTAVVNDEGDKLDKNGIKLVVYSMEDSETNILKEFKMWLGNLAPNYAYRSLDTELTYLSDEVKGEDYRSKNLPYDIYDGSITAYDKMMSVLYDETNRTKLEWAIGSVFAGESKYIEKMVVLYGKPKSGKSTVLDIIKKLFDGYWSVFISSELTNKSYQFATAAFKDNPLVAIEDDGSMTKIDSPIINEIISHKDILINEKGKQQYSIRPSSILFMATNDPVDLNDEMGGMSRRLLDVYPTNKLIPVREYRKLFSDIDYELGAIAKHCLDVYLNMGKEWYINYMPRQMINKTNYIRNFIWEEFDWFASPNNSVVTRNDVFNVYKLYIERNDIKYSLNAIRFGEQLKVYYDEYFESKWINGKTCRNVYSGFKADVFDEPEEQQIEEENYIWLNFNSNKSNLDKELKDCPAQYIKNEKYPEVPWDECTTTLRDIDTKELHYVRPPQNHIVLDFDLTNEKGEKDFNINLEAASKFKATYAELSKSGAGIHLHYIYDGDVKQLAKTIDDKIEIKVFTGKSPLRRKLSRCNDLKIETISSGLPLKEKKQMAINKDYIESEKGIRTKILNCLQKKHHGATKPEIDYIYKTLEDAYESGVVYDVNDLKNKILVFATGSTNHSEECIKLVSKMHFRYPEDVDERESGDFEKDIIVFFDIEVFKNYFCVCYKEAGEDKNVVQLINPDRDSVKELFKYKLVGFNNRRYDNHIIYAYAYMNYNFTQLYDLSQKIITKKDGFFAEAYNLSYVDVYDFSSAGNKKKLKEWEIILGLEHVENFHDWNEPLEEQYWQEVADYCSNDVIATEAVFNHLQSDFIAREILSDLSGLPVNSSTNSHTTRIIFGYDKNPQRLFEYTDLSKMFPGYKFDNGKSSYKNVEEVGEGGYVYAKIGCYTNVALLDIASMHPTSITELNLFGPYTEKFNEIKEARLAIKHKDYDKLEKMFGGKLVKYLGNEKELKDLSNALKTAINSVYGLTCSKYDVKFRDPRNKDNIVAKRGALFMIDLIEEVEKKGFVVVHVKTDSIKIANATPEIIEFVMDFGKKYGYTFEHEATYKRMCLVNDAVYIALYPDNTWTATGAEFQHPYIFKKLFSKEKIEFEDMCEMKTVANKMVLDFNEDLGEEEHNYIPVGKVGNFTPVKPGTGGGLLLREQTVNGELKYYSVTGTKGFRWKESHVVKTLNRNQIDELYFDKLCDDAIEHINKYTDFNWFANPNSNNEEVPFITKGESEDG